MLTKRCSPFRFFSNARIATRKEKIEERKIVFGKTS